MQVTRQSSESVAHLSRFFTLLFVLIAIATSTVPKPQEIGGEQNGKGREGGRDHPLCLAFAQPTPTVPPAGECLRSSMASNHGLTPPMGQCQAAEVPLASSSAVAPASTDLDSLLAVMEVYQREQLEAAKAHHREQVEASKANQSALLEHLNQLEARIDSYTASSSWQEVPAHLKLDSPPVPMTAVISPVVVPPVGLTTAKPAVRLARRLLDSCAKEIETLGVQEVMKLREVIELLEEPLLSAKRAAQAYDKAIKFR